MKLQSSDVIAFIEIWNGIRNYIPAKDQLVAAEQYISSIEDNGLVDFVVDGDELYGVCDVFDTALKRFCDDRRQNEQYINEDWEE